MKDKLISFYTVINYLKNYFYIKMKTYWHPLQEAASVNADLLFGNFEVVGVELREDSMVNLYVVELEDPYYNEG